MQLYSPMVEKEKALHDKDSKLCQLKSDIRKGKDDSEFTIGFGGVLRCSQRINIS